MGGNVYVCYDVCLLHPTTRTTCGQGNFIQPAVAAVNCTLWVIYGLCKEKRDMPLAAANMPGIIFGIITALTSL